MTTPSFLDLPDLASEDVGGAALLCNDEFFAEKENLLKPAAAVWKDHVYTDRGKWMDGWETRRRREAGYDWCVIRLGMPGVIHGVVVDTAWFRGNYPAECSIEACTIDEPLDLAALARATWTELLPRSALQGDHKNTFAIAHAERVTHLRLNIFPDGGVARLRVHGVVTPRWSRLAGLGGVIDLAALDNGGWVEACSDMFFGSRNNLIKPGPSRSMADGWETRRRRGPGHDWALVRLATRGVVERLELDTSHFKGNAPGRCVVEGCHAPDRAPTDGDWRTLLATPLQPHTRHLFDGELRRIGPITHVRLNVFPDGGVARMRVWGEPLRPEGRGLDSLDALDHDGAHAAFLRCCGSSAWARAMNLARPFEDRAALLRIGEQLWWSLGEDDWLEAFAAHPRIGARPAPAAGTAEADAWAGREQSSTANAADAVLGALATANQQYLDRHGFIYIVCATGRGADEMLADLQARVGNPRAAELRTAAEEQAKITRLRLHKLLEELA